MDRVLRRPTANDTEDDLLRLQEDFLRESNLPAKARVPPKDPPGALEERAQIVSKPNETEEIIDGDTITSDIIERRFTHLSRSDLNSQTNSSGSGFPKAIKLDLKALKDSKPKKTKMSLFARHCQAKREQNQESKPESSKTVESNLIQSQSEDPTDVYYSDIDRENRQRLAHMSEAEILEARQEVTSKLDPKTIEFLKNYRALRGKKAPIKKTSQVQFSEPVKSESVPRDTDQDKKEEDEFIEEQLPILLEEVKSKKWLNMNKLEKEKLKWTQPLKVPKKQSNVVSEARFGLSGELLTDSEKSSSIPTHEGLHHHGDEPDKPGYTLSELLTFIQSELPAQRCTGLTILKYVAEAAHLAKYCHILDPEMISTELIKCILPVRRALDDSNESVSHLALDAMRALLYNTPVGEHALDRMFPIIGIQGNFLLTVPDWPTHEESQTLTDDQLVLIDPIATLVDRTYLLERFVYLANLYKDVNMDSFSNIINRSCDILIRIARHSPEMCQRIVNFEPLITLLISLISSPHQVLRHLASDPIQPDDKSQNREKFNLAKVIKVLRLLTGANPKWIIKSDLRGGEDFLTSLGALLTISPQELPASRRAECLAMSIESLRLWSHLLASSTEAAHNMFGQLIPIVLRQIQFCMTFDMTALSPPGGNPTIGVIFDAQYAATLITCISLAASSSEKLSKLFNPLLENCLGSWLSQIAGPNATRSNLPPPDCLVAITQAIRYFVVVNSLPSPIVKLPADQSSWILSQVLTGTLSHVEAMLTSQPLGSCDALPTFGAIRYKTDDIFNVIDGNGCEGFFLNAILRLATEAQDKSSFDHIRIEKITSGLLEKFCLHQKLASKQQSQIDCVFLDPVMDSLGLLLLLIVRTDINKMSSSLKSDLMALVSYIADESIRQLLLDEAVLNEKFYQSSPSSGPYSWSLVVHYYLSESDFADTCWPLAPIWRFHTWKTMKDVNKTEHVAAYLLMTSSLQSTCPEYVKTCLGEKLLPSLGCALLASNDAFNEASLQHLWKPCIRNVFKLVCQKSLTPSNVDFPTGSKSLPFQDLLTFYDELLNHFESVSYGCDIFAAYLMGFLRMQNAGIFREKFFCEHSMAAKWIRLTESDLADYSLHLQDFLEPVESNPTILSAYYNILLHFITKDSHPLIYSISVSQLSQALFGPESGQLLNDSREAQHLKNSIKTCSNEALRQEITQK